MASGCLMTHPSNGSELCDTDPVALTSCVGHRSFSFNPMAAEQLSVIVELHDWVHCLALHVCTTPSIIFLGHMLPGTPELLSYSETPGRKWNPHTLQLMKPDLLIISDDFRASLSPN